MWDSLLKGSGCLAVAQASLECAKRGAQILTLPTHEPSSMAHHVAKVQVRTGDPLNLKVAAYMDTISV